MPEDNHTPDGEMSWQGHLTELRSRLIKSLIAIAVGMVLSAFYIDPLMALLTRYADKLYFMRPAEAFMIYFKVILVSGVVVASPVWFYQFWAFLLPAFTEREKKILALYVPASVLLFLVGIAFSFLVVLPRGLAFFMNFTTPGVTPLLSLESYLDFVLYLVLPFGFVFNLPLALILMAEAGIVTSAGLRKIRRYVIFLSFVVAAVVTPTTDMLSQCLLAVPMILLYEISVFLIRVVCKK